MGTFQRDPLKKPKIDPLNKLMMKLSRACATEEVEDMKALLFCELKRNANKENEENPISLPENILENISLNRPYRLFQELCKKYTPERLPDILIALFEALGTANGDNLARKVRLFQRSKSLSAEHTESQGCHGNDTPLQTSPKCVYQENNFHENSSDSLTSEEYDLRSSGPPRNIPARCGDQPERVPFIADHEDSQGTCNDGLFQTIPRSVYQTNSANSIDRLTTDSGELDLDLQSSGPPSNTLEFELDEASDVSSVTSRQENFSDRRNNRM